MRPPLAPVYRYAIVVSVGGLALLLALLVRDLGSVIGSATPELWIFGGCLIIGELAPIKVFRTADGQSISTTFSLALLLAIGLPAAALVQALASVIDDVIRRRPLVKLTFNAAQYTLSLGAAAGTLAILSDVPRPGGGPVFVAGDLAAVLSAAVMFFLTNSTFSGIAIALADETAVPPRVWRMIKTEAPTAVMLLSMAPIVVVAAEFSNWLVPLVALPLLAVYEGRRQATLNEHQALHDTLTGLPNRGLFHELIQQAVLQARRSGDTVVVMLMDLDRFKEVNDTLGHHYGDLLLQQIGPRLSDTMRVSDTMARLGGDEFGVLLPGVSGPEAGQQVAEKMRTALRRQFVVEGLALDIGASIGIACFPDHGHDVDALLQRADVAMYVAKERKSGYELYQREQDPHSPSRLLLAGELRRAIEAGELILNYQPKLELSTGVVVGVEALVRWQHPQRGVVSPDEFIPLAEHTGLIKPLSAYVLRQAVRQASVWQDMGLDLHIAVNLSVADLLDQDLPDDIAALLDEWNVLPNRLALELTESTIMSDQGRARSVLARLHEMGVQISIDDFGTGYSSLAHLKRLPVSEIKVDKSFVLHMATDASDAVIVRSTIDLGRNLGLRIVAEGVETEDVRASLRDLGCDLVQGYHVCRPVSAAALEEWITTSGATVNRLPLTVAATGAARGGGDELEPGSAAQQPTSA